MLGSVTMARQLGPPTRVHGHDFQSRGCQAFGPPGDDCRPAVDLAKKLRHIAGDDVDDLKLLRLERGQADRAAHGFGRPVGVAAMEFGQAAYVRHGVVDHLAGFGVLPLPCVGIARRRLLRLPGGL